MVGSQGLLSLDLAICGIEELPDHRPDGYAHVLSILDPGWPVPGVFGRRLAPGRLELRFHDVIDEADAFGFDACTEADIAALLAFGRRVAASGDQRVLVHCHMGISRSTAAAVLLLAQSHPELPERAVVAEIVRLRGKAWPNLRMIEIGDRLLGRDGRVVEAVRARHRAVAAISPDTIAFMRQSGRHREVEGF